VKRLWVPQSAKLILAMIAGLMLMPHGGAVVLLTLKSCPFLENIERRPLKYLRRR
jgi:hypothetical protein